jgi:thiamine pyrophosphate-dependent acetolactate synthase large subunit-like protein
MNSASILEQRLADHWVDVLERSGAGCVVIPASGVAESLRTAIARLGKRGKCRRLLCLDDRHAAALARGYAAATGKVALAIVGPGIGAQIVKDIQLALRDQLPLVVLLVDCQPDIPDSVDIYDSSGGADAVTLLAYAIARARFSAMRPVCIRIRSDLIEAPVQLRPHHDEIERAVSFAAHEKSDLLSDEVVQAIAEAERTLVLVGKVSGSASARAELQAFIAALGAAVIVDPLRQDAALQTLPPAGFLPDLIEEAELIISLNSTRLAELLDMTRSPAGGMIVHVSPDLPEPAPSPRGHLVPSVDIHLCTSPELAVSKLLALLTNEVTPLRSSESYPRPVEIRRNDGTSDREDVTEAGCKTQQVACISRETFVAAAAGAAAAIADAGRTPILRLSTADLVPELTVLWTLQEAGIVAVIQLDMAHHVADDLNITTLIRSFGLKVQYPEDDPSPFKHGPVVQIANREHSVSKSKEPHPRGE